MSSPANSPNIQRWPVLDGVIAPEAVTAVRLLYNGLKDHTDALTAVNNKAAAVSQPSAAGLAWSTGKGPPNGVVAAPVGSLYTDLAGGAGTTLYVKETGSGNTGWVAK